MLKKDLRLKYSNLRKDITPQVLLNSSLTIANNILEVPIWSGEFYHIFLAIPKKNEVDTSFILSILHGKDKNVVLPKVTEEKTLKHYLLTDSTKLRLSNWGVPEPSEGIEVQEEKIDVVFVPLLAFDKRGNRVGYGKGYYDAFLRKCKTNVLKVGLSLFEPDEEISDINAYDIPLDYCVTPSNIYSFSTV